MTILLKAKYLPTVSDFHALVKELEAKDNQFRPHTSYRRFAFPTDRIGVEKPWEPTDYGAKMDAWKKRLTNKGERLKMAREKYGQKVWMDNDGWLHTGEPPLEDGITA